MVQILKRNSESDQTCTNLGTIIIILFCLVSVITNLIMYYSYRNGIEDFIKTEIEKCEDNYKCEQIKYCKPQGYSECYYYTKKAYTGYWNESQTKKNFNNTLIGYSCFTIILLLITLFGNYKVKY